MICVNVDIVFIERRTWELLAKDSFLLQQRRLIWALSHHPINAIAVRCDAKCGMTIKKKNVTCIRRGWFFIDLLT